jgi:hypothetical protein
MWFIKPTKGSPNLKSAREYSNKMFEKSEICSVALWNQICLEDVNLFCSGKF